MIQFTRKNPHGCPTVFRIGTQVGADPTLPVPWLLVEEQELRQRDSVCPGLQPHNEIPVAAGALQHTSRPSEALASEPESTIVFSLVPVRILVRPVAVPQLHSSLPQPTRLHAAGQAQSPRVSNMAEQTRHLALVIGTLLLVHGPVLRGRSEEVHFRHSGRLSDAC